MSALPSEAAARVEYPMADGLLFYFPAALAWVSRCSKVGNDQHNPGEPLHWAMDKSTDHANKIIRHLMEIGTDDTDGVPHSVKVAWRALALAQEDLMARKGAPMPRNGRKATEHGSAADCAPRFGYPGSFCGIEGAMPLGGEAALPLRRDANDRLYIPSASPPPNCDAFARYGATHSKADALRHFARDDEATGL